jgi:tRNA (adenine37-N6)-methyltransferase
MTESCIQYKPIGVFHSRHAIAEETPIQPAYAKGCRGRAEIFPEYEEGLRDLDGFSHIYLIYHLHLSESVKLTVKPFLQDVERGVFATRAPSRPNAIGLSIVELVSREGMSFTSVVWISLTVRRVEARNVEAGIAAGRCRNSCRDVA